MRPSLFCLTALILIQGRDGLAKDASTTPVVTVDWAQLKEAGKLESGEVVPSQDGAPPRLKIVSTAASATSPPATPFAERSATTMLSAPVTWKCGITFRTAASTSRGH
jgi:hypothetical protein